MGRLILDVEKCDAGTLPGEVSHDRRADSRRPTCDQDGASTKAWVAGEHRSNGLVGFGHLTFCEKRIRSRSKYSAVCEIRPQPHVIPDLPPNTTHWYTVIHRLASRVHTDV